MAKAINVKENIMTKAMCIVKFSSSVFRALIMTINNINERND